MHPHISRGEITVWTRFIQVICSDKMVNSEEWHRVLFNNLSVDLNHIHEKSQIRVVLLDQLLETFVQFFVVFLSHYMHEICGNFIFITRKERRSSLINDSFLGFDLLPGLLDSADLLKNLVRLFQIRFCSLLIQV